MRNLKKILALVMALVMSMSLVTIANAADFTDNDDISYEEAADVMNAIGVIEGYEDGSFDPNGTLVREEAATLVTRMLLGDNAGSLGIERSTFDDVLTTRWSAPAIEYCVSLGIIDGAGDGNFYPRGQLTAVAFAKVLLTALGYDADTEGLVGATWSVNTAALAMEVGLDDGIEDLTWNAAITREQAAQMALNTIKAPLVAYEGGVTVVVGDTPVSFGSGDAYYITTTLAREQRISDEQLSNSNDYTVEFGEHYFPNLRLIREADEFERPSHTWTYNGDEIGSYTDYDLQVATYTEAVTGRELYDLLGSSTIADYSIAYYVDGVSSDVIRESNMIRTNTRDYDTTDNGVLTQVFVDHTNEEITITSVNTYLAQADADYNESRGELSLTVYYEDAAGSGKTVEVEEIDSITGYQEGDFVLVNLSGKDSGRNDIAYMDVVRVNDVESMVDCTVTGYSTNNYVTVDGEDYDYAAKAFYDSGVLDKYNQGYLDSYTYTFYMDQYGYVIGAEIYEGEANYVFITGYDINGSNLSVNTATAGAIFLDGTMRSIQVDVQDTNDNIEAYNDDVATAREYSILSPRGNGRPGNINNDGESEYNHWFRYTVDTDNVYTLDPVTNWVNEDATVDGEEVNSASIRVGTDMATRAYGNDESVYITVDTGAVDYTTTRGITKTNGIYTGIQEVDLRVASVSEIGLNDGYSIFALYDDDRYIIGAVIIGEDVNNSQNYAYILDSEAQREYRVDGTDYWDVEAIVDNQLVTLTIEDYDGTISQIQRDLDRTRYERGAMYRVTYNADDHVIEAELCEDAKDYVYGNTEYTDRAANLEDFGVYNVLGVSDQALNLRGRALYIGNTGDYGLFLESDAAIFVVQYEEDSRGNTELFVERYTNANSALNALANKDSFSGTISAVLSDAGTAEYLVLNSDDNVNLTTDSGDTGHDTGDYYSVSMSNLFGYGTVRFTGYRPDFANDAGTVTFTYDILADGRVIAHETLVLNGNPSLEDVDTQTWNGYLGSPDVVLSIDNVEMVCQYIDVRYVDAAGNDISAHVVDGGVGTIFGTTSSSLDISLESDGVYETGTDYRWSVEGATVTGGNSGTGTVDTADTKTITPTGNDFVTITYSGMEPVDNGYAVVEDDGLTTAEAGMIGLYGVDASNPATTMDSLGLTGYDDTLAILVTGPSNNVTGLSAGDLVTFAATLTGNDDAVSYDVIIDTSEGDVVISDVADGTSRTGTVRVDDADITIYGVEVRVHTPKLATPTARMTNSNTTMVITFNTPVDDGSGAALDESVFGVTEGSKPADVSAALVSDFDAGTTSSDTITIEFDRALSAGDKITVGTPTGICNVEDNTDTLTGTSIEFEVQDDFSVVVTVNP